MKKYFVGAVGIIMLLVSTLVAEVGPMPTCDPGPNGSINRHCAGHVR